MYSGVELEKMVGALTQIAGILQQLGVPGLVALVFSGPVVLIIAMLGLDYLRQRVFSLAIEQIRIEMRASIEAYRTDAQTFMKELGENQAHTDKYYRDNVELVKQYERMAENLFTAIVDNTRASERLVTILEERRNIH